MREQKSITIVAFGDSITEATHQEPGNRWVELVGRELSALFPDREITLINAGVGGNTSREGLVRIEDDVLRHSPDIVLFEFGNDATPDQDRHVSLDEYRKNIETIIDLVADKASGMTIPMTFSPIVDEWHACYGDPIYEPYGGQEACQELYRDVVRSVAGERSLPLVDLGRELTAMIERDGASECILEDGVHLTASGNSCVAEAVLRVLKSVIGEEDE